MSGGLYSTPVPRSQDDALADAVRWGMGEAQIRDISRAGGGDVGERNTGVWAQNREVILAFLAIASQWRTGVEAVPGMGLRTFYLGLDYSAAQAGLELAGINITPALWGGIRVMESAAREALNEKGLDR